MAYIEGLNKGWKEAQATHREVCEEPDEQEAQLCAVCNCYPVHLDCIYCEDCCGDDALDFLGPQA